MVKLGHKLEHPGAVLWGEFLQPNGITQTRFARDLDISYQRVNEIINGKRSIQPDTALRIARYFSMSAEFWMNWQAAYDLQAESLVHGKDIAKIPVFRGKALA
ncbi:MAG: HigA family addiction module antidote protein [Nitrospinae bacterium]|nr:HigA family addiction module antidote protein [Nitrospinota bacterium]